MKKGIQAKKQIILSNLILRSFDLEQRDDGYSFISTKLYIYVFYYYDTTYGLLFLSGGIIRYSVIVYIRYIFY
jgi:hypothetical protein